MGIKIVTDDFGMSTEINNAISDLVGKKIVSKVSIAADESVDYSIGDLGNNIEIGLHINLLSGELIKVNHKQKKTTLLRFLFSLYTGQLSCKQIKNSINDQSRVLEQRGFQISYFDTHQHIHIVPKILEAIIDCAKTKGISSIRCVTMEKKYLFYYLYALAHFGFIKQIPKIMFLYLMGILMKVKLDRAKINYCRNLILMPLATDGNYSGLLREMLEKFKAEDAELVMHPGMRTEAAQFDDYSERYIEYRSVLDLMCK